MYSTTKITADVDDSEELFSLSEIALNLCSTSPHFKTQETNKVFASELLEENHQLQSKVCITDLIDIKDIKQEKQSTDCVELVEDNHQVQSETCFADLNDIKHEKQSNSYDTEQEGKNQVSDDDATDEVHGSHSVPEDECIICLKCNKWFKSEKLLKSHVRIVHNTEKPFKCTQCDKMFANKHGLKIHKEVHVDQSNIPDLHGPDDLHDDKKLFKCNYEKKPSDCPVTCTHSKQSIPLKSRKSFSGPRYYKFQCIICKKSFKRQSCMKKHQKRHKPVQCTLCGESFVGKELLKTHKLQKHKKDKYQCVNCHKVFSRKDVMITHEVVCLYKEKQNSVFQFLHNQTNHEEKPFQCPKCDIPFKFEKNLNFHYVNCHIISSDDFAKMKQVYAQHDAFPTTCEKKQVDGERDTFPTTCTEKQVDAQCDNFPPICIKKLIDAQCNAFPTTCAKKPVEAHFGKWNLNGMEYGQRGYPRVQEAGKVFECMICSMAFENIIDFNSHYKIHK